MCFMPSEPHTQQNNNILFSISEGEQASSSDLIIPSATKSEKLVKQQRIAKHHSREKNV